MIERQNKQRETRLLLVSLEKNIDAIINRLASDKKRQLLDLLRKVKAAANKSDFEKISDSLCSFCLSHSFLREALLEAEAREKKPIVFRGKPIPKSMTQEINRMRLMTNRLIDAIENADSTRSEIKNAE